MQRTFLLFAFLIALFPALSRAENVIDFVNISKNLDAVETTLQGENLTPADIKNEALYLSNLSASLAEIKNESERQINSLQKQLSALGEAPTDGSKELDIVSKKRQELVNDLSIVRSRIAEADILQVKIEELSIKALNAQSQHILGNLFEKTESFVQPKHFLDGVYALVSFFFDIVKSPLNWFDGLDEQNKAHVLNYLIPALFLLVATFGIGFMLRRLIMRLFGYRAEIDNPRYGQKISAAIAVAIGYGLIPSVIIGVFLVWIIGLQIFNDTFFGVIVTSTLFYLLYVFLAKAIARVTFAPYNEKWRLINVKTPKALDIVRALYIAIIFIGAISLLEHIALTQNYPATLIEFLTLIACAVKASSIILLVCRIFEEEDEPQPTTAVVAENTALAEEDLDDGSISTSLKIIFLTVSAAVITFGVAVSGYLELASFIFNRFIASVILLVLTIIIQKLATEILKHILLLGFWSKTFKLRRKLLRKINFGLSLFLTPLIGLFFIFALLNIWGLSGTFILHIARKLLFGFKVGGVTISLLAIVLGIIVFFASLAFVKYIKNRLTNNLFSQLDIDDGIRHSLSSGVSFVGFILSSLLAIVVMGGDLTSFAVIAGALSVGIGFGLQNIINNFVSGIIILFERPFKIGDWVILNGEEGQIKQINIRSTELETFSKTSVIIPNATLIASSMTNLTHGNNWTRQSVKVGVAYGTDVNKVTEILLECARNNKKVLKVPAPYVLFQDFGASSLDFELRCYSNNIWSGWVLPSELRYDINRRFKEEGIEIPFPQMVLHKGDEPEKQSDAEKKPKKAKTK